MNDSSNQNPSSEIKTLAEQLEAKIAKAIADSVQEAGRLSNDSVKTEAAALFEAIKAISLMENDLKYIKQDISEVKVKLDEHYVTKAEFDPVRNIVYGMVGVILLAVIGALVTLVVRK